MAGGKHILGKAKRHIFGTAKVGEKGQIVIPKDARQIFGVKPGDESLGVSRAVYEYGEMILDGLRPRFEAIDRTAEYNQTKVLAAMQKNKLSAGCFAATTGYGYDDMGREVLEKVYADCFHTEAALVRPQITCGTARRMTRWRRSSASVRPSVR